MRRLRASRLSVALDASLCTNSSARPFIFPGSTTVRYQSRLEYYPFELSPRPARLPLACSCLLLLILLLIPHVTLGKGPHSFPIQRRTASSISLLLLPLRQKWSASSISTPVHLALPSPSFLASAIAPKPSDHDLYRSLDVN